MPCKCYVKSCLLNAGNVRSS
uniref:Uncharacterized protein n=1 Tax=Anguilla anguilla TaxID=7936 RepID=A0A0E9QKR8_ANGAN